MSFWCEFLDSHLTKYHLNIGDQIVVVFDLGTFALHLGVSQRDLGSKTTLVDLTFGLKIGFSN
jgi:hypothetical protein